MTGVCVLTCGIVVCGVDGCFAACPPRYPQAHPATRVMARTLAHSSKACKTLQTRVVLCAWGRFIVNSYDPIPTVVFTIAILHHMNEDLSGFYCGARSFPHMVV